LLPADAAALRFCDAISARVHPVYKNAAVVR
jgi:hypothetical protein